MHLALQLLSLPILYGVFKLLRFAYAEYTSPLRLLPGPKSTHWIFGNFKEILNSVGPPNASPDTSNYSILTG